MVRTGLFHLHCIQQFWKRSGHLGPRKKIEKEKEQQRTKNASTIDDDDDDDDDFNDGDGYLNYSGNNETTPGDQRASDDGWSLKDVIANTYALEDGTQVGPVKKY